MRGVQKTLNLKVGEHKDLGTASISAYEFKTDDNPLYNLRHIRDGNGFLMMSDGKYVRLIIDGRLVMSDTDMEKNTNREFVEKANGKVLIAGLGIGLVLENLKEKVKKGKVTEITIVEINKDVIHLISPYYADMPIKYINESIFDFKPEKGVLYDTIYFDIWHNIDTNNLDEIKTLHNKFKFNLNRENPYAWMNSWMTEWLRNRRAKERRDENRYGWY